jgi:YLP motif-containing protein 1
MSLILVDDRNLRVADFTQFWATAKRSGYEAYILEATYKDPTVSSLHTIYSSISLILYLICSFHF